jgi:hypothetical protein
MFTLKSLLYLPPEDHRILQANLLSGAATEIPHRIDSKTKIDDLEITIGLRICLFDNHRRNVIPHRLQVDIREKIIDHDFNQLPTLEDIHPKGFIASFDLLEGGYQPRQQTGVLSN